MAEPMTARLRQRPNLDQPNPLFVQSKTAPKSTQQRSAEYQDRLKLDPKKYQERLADQKVRSKRDREKFENNACEEEKERRRAMNNERVKKWRAKKKAEGDAAHQTKLKSTLPMTRKQKEKEEERKRKDRERKQRERDNWSSQKRSAENKKASSRYHSSKKPKVSQVNVATETLESELDNRTPAARAMAVSRLNCALPKGVNARQATITDFVSRHKRDTTKTCSLTEVILSSNGLDSRENLQLKRLLAKKLIHTPKPQKTQLQSELQLRSDQVKKLASKLTTPLKKPKRKFVELVKDVHSYFLDNSRILPLKRRASRQPTRVLERTLRVLYTDYLQNYPYVSFSFFCKYRPKYVKSQSSTKFNQALCENCENLDLKLKAVNAACSRPVVKNKDELLTKIMCAKNGKYFQPNCIQGKCGDCGPKKIWDFVQEEELDREIEVRRWGMLDVMRGGQTLKKKALIREVLSVREIIRKIEIDLAKFPQHDFMAKWQYHMFNMKRKNLKAGEVLAVLDFAENYRCSLQDEAQAAHWNYCQATIHPIVCYYGCRECEASATESIVIVSNDLTHDAAAVQSFTKAACDHLRSKLDVLKLIQFTDGCAAQYKSKMPFSYIRGSQQTLGVPVERNFFGSRHGKNPSDGESAVIKNAATRAVKNRQAIIQTAEDLFQYCVDNLERGQEDGGCVHYRRKFIFVDSQEVERQRNSQNEGNVPPTAIKGTRAIHSIKAKDGGLVFRNASCFCGEEPCSNTSYVDPWQPESKKKKAPRSKKSQATAEETEPLETSNLDVLSQSTLEYLDEIDENMTEELSTVNHQPPPVLAIAQIEPEAQMEEEAQMERHVQFTENPVVEHKSNEQTETIFPGAWVAASFPGKVSKIFLGTVLEVDDQEASVKFCRQTGQYFTWPVVEDIGWMPFYSLTPITAPTMDGRERLSLPCDTLKRFFSFS